MLAVELHRLALNPLRIALVLGAQRVDLRLQRLHCFHRPHALERQREEDHLREYREQDDGDAVVMGVVIEPAEEPQDRHRYPFHREAAVALGEGETTEINRLFETYPERLQPIVFLGTHIVEHAAVPALARLERGESDSEARLNSLPDLALRQTEPGRLRHKGRQVPLALETDPLAVTDEIHDLRQILVPHASIGRPNDPRGVLALELLRNVLGPCQRSAPHDDNGRLLHAAAPILDADDTFYVVVVALKRSVS